MPAPISPSIKVEGSLLPDRLLSLLTSVRIDRALGVVGRTVLRFDDHGFALSSSSTFALGKAVQIALYGSSTLLFKGEVVGIALDQEGDQVPQLVVTADDLAHRLGRAASNETFLNHTWGDVVSKMAAKAGLSADTTMPGGSTQAYLLKTGSDLDFLNEVARRTGTAWWVDPLGHLKVKPAGTSTRTVDVTLGVELVRFSVRATAAAVDEVQVTGWDVGRQETMVGTTTKAATAAESAFVTGYPGRGGSTSATVVATSRVPIDQGEAAVMAAAFTDEARSSGMTARGTTWVDERIAPSTSVKVAGAGPASGTYLVTGVEHRYDRRGFLTTFTAGSHRPSGLVDVLGPTPSTAGFSTHGVVIAVVTNINDTEKKLGRVKVKFGGSSGDLESEWARIVTLGAGNKRGMVFSPEVGDEVLVAFEGGDTRRPVVLGGLHNTKYGLPTTDNNDGKQVNYRRITSRLGHVLELSDDPAAAKQHVLIQHGTAQHKILLGQDKLDIVVDSVPVRITNGQATIELTKAGDVTITAKNIKLKADANVEIEAVAVKLKGSGQVQVQGMQVDVKADGTGSLQAGGPLTVKGATVAIN